MELTALAAEYGYDHDGQHIVLPFRVGPPARAARHPVAEGGKLTVAATGYVAGMILDSYDGTAFGTMSSERLAVFSLDDEQLETLARVAQDALAMRRALRDSRS